MNKYISNSCVIAAIMKINMKYLNEIYVSEKQLGIVTWYIQKKLIEFNSNIRFVNYVDNYYFEDIGYKVVLKDEYINSFFEVENNFKRNLPNELLSIIWDENLMYSIALKNFNEILEKNKKILLTKK